MLFMLQPYEFTKSFSFLYRLEGTRSNCGQTLYPKALFMLYVILSLQVMQCVAVDVTVLQLCWVLTCKTYMYMYKYLYLHTCSCVLNRDSCGLFFAATMCVFVCMHACMYCVFGSKTFFFIQSVVVL